VCDFTSGNVGIGTEKPYDNLHVSGLTGSANAQVRFAGTLPVTVWVDTDTGESRNGFRIFTSGGVTTFGSVFVADEFSAPSSGTSILTLDMKTNTEEKVGISSTTPGAKLSILQADNDPGLILTNTGSDVTVYIEDEADDASPFVIDESGNVGIGEKNPATQLELANTSGTGYIRLTSGTNNPIISLNKSGLGKTAKINFLSNSASQWYFGTPDRDDVGDGDEIFFGLNSPGTNPIMWLEPSGNIGIGTTSPFARLSVAATSTPTLDNQALFAVSTSTSAATTTAFIVDADGNVGIGVGSPSYNLDVDGDIALDNTATNRLILPSSDDAVTPTLRIGDDGTGIYATDTNTLRIAFDGTAQIRVTSTSLSGQGNDEASIRWETSSLTNPTLIPSHSDSDTGIGGDGSNIVALIAGGTTGLITDSSGNVGIGTTTIGAQLSILQTDNIPGLILTNTGSGNTVYIEDIADDTTPFVIDESGNVGIGTASPEQKLDIFISGGDPTLHLDSGSGEDAYFLA